MSIFSNPVEVRIISQKRESIEEVAQQILLIFESCAIASRLKHNHDGGGYRQYITINLASNQQAGEDKNDAE